MFSDLLKLENLSKEQQTKAISLSKKFSSTNKTDLKKQIIYYLAYSAQIGVKGWIYA